MEGVSSCSYCYKRGATKKCGKCNSRRICSTSCQKADWAIHKHWCGIAGECGVDVVIKPTTDGKGFGMFATRAFKKDEFLMVERSLVRYPNLDTEKFGKNFDFGIPESAKEEFATLKPSDASTLEKLQYNGLVYEDKQGAFGGLCLRSARINHSCLPNCEIHFRPTPQLVVVVACRNIEKGEELFRSYIGNDVLTMDAESRKEVSRRSYM